MGSAFVTKRSKEIHRGHAEISNDIEQLFDGGHGCTAGDTTNIGTTLVEVEELIAGQYIVRWTSVLSNRFDSTAFKKVLPDLYKAYTKQVSSRRFSISV